MSEKNTHEKIIILDFGSQYTQLIARRVRDNGVYCEIIPFSASLEEILAQHPRGIILSGSPSSVYEEKAPRPDPRFLDAIECPVLGICYGLQVLAADLGGEVEASDNREYGYARLKILDNTSQLFADLPSEMDVWMSHGDHVTVPPQGFHVTAITDGALNAFESLSKRIYGLQFHPEVAHTPLGSQILRNFLLRFAVAVGDWTPAQSFRADRAHTGQLGEAGKAVCGLSGGVDSTVAAVLVHQAIGERQTCIFVNNGLLREGEFELTSDYSSKT